MRHSIVNEAIAILVVFAGLLTAEYWIPYWVAFWQFAFALAFKLSEILI